MMQPKSNNEALRQESHLILRQLLAMIDHSPGLEIQQFALEAMVRLTGSHVGFIYAVDSSAGTAQLENIVKPDQESRLIPRGPIEEFSDKGFWHFCLNAERHALGEIPESAPPQLGKLHHGLMVPLHKGEALIAVIGIANCPTPYQAVDRSVLQELATGLGRVVVRKKLHDSMPDDLK